MSHRCKYCNSEMAEMEHDNILGYWSYSCMNEECGAELVIDDSYDEWQWEEPINIIAKESVEGE